MKDVIREKDAVVYDVYTFSGLWQYKRKGRELKTMSLKECFENVFSSYYARNMKRFYENTNFNFDKRRATISDIFRWIEQGFAIVPFSVSVDKQDVIKYLDIGLQVLFMKAGEFKKMQKAYKEYV